MSRAFRFNGMPSACYREFFCFGSCGGRCPKVKIFERLGHKPLCVYPKSFYKTKRDKNQAKNYPKSKKILIWDKRLQKQKINSVHLIDRLAIQESLQVVSGHVDQADSGLDR